MSKSRNRIESFIETENAFAVMGELKKQGLLTKDDMNKATSMTREQWLKFMKQKAGILPED